MDALLVMALITTGLSGPLLQLAEHRGRTVVDQNIRPIER